MTTAPSIELPSCWRDALPPTSVPNHLVRGRVCRSHNGGVIDCAAHREGSSRRASYRMSELLPHASRNFQMREGSATTTEVSFIPLQEESLS